MWPVFGICGYFFANYADDITPYTVGDNTEEVITELTNISQKLYTWFSDNQTKADHINAICFWVRQNLQVFKYLE